MYTGLPMAFMLISSLVALLSKLRDFWRADYHLLLAAGTVLLLLAVGIIVEGVRAFMRRDRYSDDLVVFAVQP